ncbi:MAG: hypothetical protein N2662_08290 [Bacteroidales bacterium]|nr:hypothetical protein [Bacteroidales bacterium]
MKRIQRIFGFSVLIASLVACVEKEYDFNKLSTEIVYDPKLAFTIGTMTVDLESLLSGYTDSSNIKVADDKTITVSIATNFRSVSAFESLPLPPQSMIVIPGFVFPPTMPAGGVVSRDTIINIPVTFFEDAEIDSLLVKILSYSLNGTSTYSSAFSQELTLSLLDMKQGNMVYVENFSVSPFNNLTNLNNAAGYMLRFRNITAGAGETRLYVRLTLRGSPGTPINPASSLNLTMQINQLDYKLVYGYIGQPYIMDIVDTFFIDFLGREFAKNIEWKDPSITLYTTNSYVAPTDFFVQSVKVVSYDNKELMTNPDNSKIQNPKDIAYPTLIGQVAKDSVICDRIGYSDMYNAIEKEAPKYIIMHLKSKANPHTKTHGNIMSDTSSIRSQVVMRLPIKFRSSGFSQTDTMDFELSKLATGGDSTNSNVKVTMKSMLFRIASSNSMPIDMRLQVYFVDENYQILDSLYKDSAGDNLIIKSGTIDPNTGRVSVPRLWKKDVIFDENQLKKLENTKHVIFRLTGITYDYANTKPYVTFFADDKLSITFAAQLQPSIHVYENKNNNK